MKLLRIAAVLTLMALALIVLSLLTPHPLAIMLAMSVGQGLGTIAFLLYLVVIARDLKRRGVLSTGDVEEDSG
jgi:hypothetical protein